MQAIRTYNKCVFGRNLYETYDTDSILEISLALYCPLFQKMKYSFFTSADFFKSSFSNASHFDVGLILYFWQCR